MFPIERKKKTETYTHVVYDGNGENNDLKKKRNMLNLPIVSMRAFVYHNFFFSYRMTNIIRVLVCRLCDLMIIQQKKKTIHLNLKKKEIKEIHVIHMIVNSIRWVVCCFATVKSVMRGNGNKLKTDVGILNFINRWSALPCLMFTYSFYILYSFASISWYLEWVKRKKKVKLKVDFFFLFYQ